jgi:ribosome-binding protein aMBF1 (putative translation factor)
MSGDRRLADAEAPPARARRWTDDPDIRGEHERVALDVGRALYQLRERQDWSQERLAAAAGLSDNTVSAVERATTDPQLSTLIRLLWCLGYRLVVSVRR